MRVPSYVRGEAVKEKFFEERVVGCRLVVPQQLLHTAEELGGFSVAELFSAEQRLRCSEAAVSFMSSPCKVSHGRSSGGGE